MRLVADAVKGKSVVAAMTKLQFLAKASSLPILKTIKSAAANATHNLKLKMENLTVKNILVDEGTKMKRRDTSHGARFGGGMIAKRTAHVKVILEGKE
ncbi:50S ribosomal protein L22 [Candidatus Microgenomates bacterium]|nr:50S ribosomal protein L22 [Candidatus Microgenomates bacterium]